MFRCLTDLVDNRADGCDVGEVDEVNIGVYGVAERKRRGASRSGASRSGASGHRLSDNSIHTTDFMSSHDDAAFLQG